MVRIICLLGLFISFCSAGQSRGPIIDSLENRLKETSSDSFKIDILNQLAELYYNADIKKSLVLGQESLNLSKKIGYEHGMYGAHKILRRVHRRLGNYSIAIEFTLETLPILEKIKDTTELLDAYMTLGNINSAMENFPDAHRALAKALILARKTDAPVLANTLNYMGRNQGKMGNYDSALIYIKEALKREVDFPQPGYGLSYIYNNLGEVYLEMGRYDEAIHFYNLSNSLGEERKSPFGKTFTLNGLAKTYQRSKQYDKAIASALQSIAIAKENFFRDKAKEAYGILYEVYAAKQDYKKALEYYQQFNLYQDSIFSDDKVQLIENLKINYETERIEQENELLRKNTELQDSILKQQSAVTWVAVIAIAFLLTGSFLLYRINQQRRKNNSMLQEYNQSLEREVTARTQELVATNVELGKQNSQLEQFSYIIAHNLRAPVARIRGLVNIFKNYNLPDNEVVNKLQSSATELDTTIEDLTEIIRVKKGVADSYNTVDLNDRLERIKIVLRDKIREVQPELKINLAQKTCYGIPAYIDSILYNLVSNALKYRSPDRRLVLEISTCKQDGKCCMTVADNGMGLNLAQLNDKLFNLYQRFHNHVEGKGIGLFLVKTQVEALNGTIEVESEEGKGTTFKICLPDKS